MENAPNRTAALANVVNRLLENLAQFLPNLLGAVALLLVGWIIARLLRVLAVRLTRLLDQLMLRVYERRGFARPRVPLASAEIMGGIVFWLVMLFFLVAATQVLGLSAFLNWLDRLVTYLPTLFAGGLIVLAGWLVAKLVNDLIRATATPATQGQRALLGRAAQVAIFASAIVIGADQIGIRITFLVIMATVLVAAVLGGAALAVSFGAKTYVANLIGARAARETYRVGQVIRVADREGRILDMTPTAVVLETADGRVLVPGKAFHDEASVLRLDGGGHGQD